MSSPAGLIKDAPVTFEYQMFELRLGMLRTMLVNIYRPPAGGLARFCDELSNFLKLYLQGLVTDCLCVVI